MARIKVGGFIVVFNHIPALIVAVEANSMTVPKKVADKIAASARARAPVATGYLRSSISAQSLERGKTAQIIAEAPYAPFVEYGTYKMAARPFLTPAVVEHQEEFMIEVAKPVMAARIK